jgi:hypothetical protein
MKMLIVLIAMESSSGKEPLDVDYMKAWALLNLRSAHRTSGLAQYTHLNPFEDWKSHERALLDQYHVNGSVESQMENLLKRYDIYASGESLTISPDKFAMIESVVRQAGREWYVTGRGSSIDPVKGATDFTAASGCYYPNGNSKTDTILNQIPDFESKLMTDRAAMETFRNNMAKGPVVSELYSVDIWPYTGQEMWTFTIFSY